VREVFREIEAVRETGYTSVLKVMQIMTEKGALVRDESVRPQVYRVSQARSKTQKALVTDLLERAFGGAPGNLVLAALSSQKTTPEERRKIQELLDKHEQGEA
jgi:predicted transcriptional regulator